MITTHLIMFFKAFGTAVGTTAINITLDTSIIKETTLCTSAIKSRTAFTSMQKATTLPTSVTKDNE